jgi:hypothetical protein
MIDFLEDVTIEEIRGFQAKNSCGVEAAKAHFRRVNREAYKEDLLVKISAYDLSQPEDLSIILNCIVEIL